MLYISKYILVNNVWICIGMYYMHTKFYVAVIEIDWHEIVVILKVLINSAWKSAEIASHVLFTSECLFLLTIECIFLKND